MSNIGKWNSLYKNISVKNRDSHPIKFGDGTTYRIAAAFLADVAQVEDWGCGTGGFKEFCLVDYIGVDGSVSPYADRIADLSEYRTKTAAIHIRHVLEHNYDWETILENALASAEHKLCICIFTPFAPSTVEIATNLDINVPVLSLSKEKIEKHFDGFYWRLIENIPTNTEYRQEHVYLVWKYPDVIREHCEVELRQTKQALLAMTRERDLLAMARKRELPVAACSSSAKPISSESSFGEELLVKFYRKYMRRFIGRCRRLILGR